MPLKLVVVKVKSAGIRVIQYHLIIKIDSLALSGIVMAALRSESKSQATVSLT